MLLINKEEMLIAIKGKAKKTLLLKPTEILGYRENRAPNEVCRTLSSQ